MSKAKAQYRSDAIKFCGRCEHMTTTMVGDIDYYACKRLNGERVNCWGCCELWAERK